jgi:hypothetical protein
MMSVNIRIVVSELYKTHSYVYKKLKNYEQIQFERIVYAAGSVDASWTKTLSKLSEYLRVYHKQRCIVLIDEYDHPLDVAFRFGYYETARAFFASLLGGLLKVIIAC